jgi:Skp family chaperone for outer membrane proteins
MQLTRGQLQARKDKAVRFTRDVLGDPARAEEIEDESLEDYAERRRIHVINPKRRNRSMAREKTKADLEQEIANLQEENQELQDQLAAVADIVSPDDDETGDEDELEDEEDEDDDDDLD